MFAEILGQEPVKQALGRAIVASRFPPAILLAGPEGVGKRTLALAAARAVLCAGDPPGCGACAHCRRIDRSLAALGEWQRDAAGRTDDPTRLNHRVHPDLVLVEPWKTGIKIDQIRDLVGEIASSPFEARSRVFVIDDAHLMNEAAANALLKSLEEPPQSSHLVLVSASPQNLLPTIRSRCQLLRCGPIASAALERRLVEAHALAPEEARLRVALAGGSLKAALSFDSDEFRERREEALRFLEEAGGDLERLQAAERLGENEDLAPLLLALRSLLRDLLALRSGAPEAALLNADLAPRLRALASGPLGASAGALGERTAEILLALKGNASRPLSADLLGEALAAADPRR
ncbi:MAG: ATP-binding protein [Vicinamibacteria bacterium]